jgi:hypothetical protein
MEVFGMAELRIPPMPESIIIQEPDRNTIEPTT